jgi:general stress protein 26
MYEVLPTLKTLLHGIAIGMLTTVEIDGSLQSRPMRTQAVDANGVLWFFASRSLHQASIEKSSPLVNVVYSHPGLARYVSVCGRVAAVDDAVRRRQLWSDCARSWFKDGPDDADLVLLRVDVEHVDYWEGQANVLTRLIGFSAALTDGDIAIRH